ncbi:ATP-binding protein [Streptosporangium canum]|uniref:sensor histidine kinase n=1 Tax=Streptosporangium canum TaxID=324952 RepID=UPI00343C8BB1
MTAVTSSRVLAASLATVAAAGIVAGGLMETGLPAPFSQWLFIAVCMLLRTIGWLVAARRPDNAYGWLLLGAALCLGSGALGTSLLLREETGHGPLAGVAAVLASLFTVFYGLSWVFIPLLFPDGRLPSRRWRAGAWIAGTAIAAHWAGVLFAPDSLALLREQARQTLTDLRELAAGIHPSVLSQGGLVEAVEERCSRLPVTTTVAADAELRARRFPDEIEGALYFTVSEAIANALKHAAASRIEVRLTHAGGRLQVVVSDDGKGFDPAVAGRGGLGPLADRMSALGGRLDLAGGPGEGTRLRAWVPMPG